MPTNESLLAELAYAVASFSKTVDAYRELADKISWGVDMLAWSAAGAALVYAIKTIRDLK